MYNLTLHIEYLLLRHDCIVLPGIGAFINVRHASRLDSESGIWYPMTREVRFNSALVHDDGLLANSYSRKYQTSYNEGRELLRRDLERLQVMLKTDGEVTMGQLGILHYNEGLITFQPRQTASQSASALGYVPVSMFSPKAKHIEEANSAVEENEAEQPEATTKNKGRIFDTEHNYYIAVNKIFARTVACLMVVATIVLSIMIPTTDSKRMDQASVVPVEKIIRESLSQTEHPVIEQHPAATVKANEVSGAGRIEEGSYHAIVATFRSIEEAGEFIEQNKASGYELQSVPTATRVRVSAMRSDNQEELQQLISSEGFRRHFSSVWIWNEEK